MDKVLKNLHWFIIAYAVFDFYTLYDASNTKMTELENQLQAEKTLYDKNKKSENDIKNYYANIATEKARIETVAQEIEKTQQLLPSEISDIENLTLLRNLAEVTNIKEISIAPDKDVTREFVIARRYKVKLKATFLQILIMFEKIGESTRILNIGEASFNKINEVQRGKFQLIQGDFILEAYRFNSGYKEDRGIENIENQFKNPNNKQNKKDTGT